MLVGLTFVTQMIATKVSGQHAASDSYGYVGGPEEESQFLSQSLWVACLNRLRYTQENSVLKEMV
jgi:hypothetical protein